MQTYKEVSMKYNKFSNDNYSERFSFTKKDNTMSFHNGQNRYLVELYDDNVAYFYWLQCEQKYLGRAPWNGRKFKNPPTLDSTDPLLIQYIERKMSDHLPFHSETQYYDIGPDHTLEEPAKIVD